MCVKVGLSVRKVYCSKIDPDLGVRLSGVAVYELVVCLASTAALGHRATEQPPGVYRLEL